MAKMKWSQFKKGLDLSLKVNTTYAFGSFGWQLNSTYKKRLLDNKSNANDKTIRDGITKGNDNTFAFDCVCLPKGILWGWNANNKVNYGGAVYKSNGVPDVNADQMMTSAHVDNLSTNFSKIKVGAFVGMKGHMGIYIGNGEVVECTPKWGAKVLKSKLSERKWVNWGMSKYIDYSELDSKPSFKPYKMYLTKGTPLYDDKFKEYAIPIQVPRDVTIVDEKSGYGKFNDSSLIGTNHAWVKVVAKSTDIKVGTMVKVKEGAKYQKTSNGKTFPAWAAKNAYPIAKIDGKDALIGGGINSWVKLEDCKLA